VAPNDTLPVNASNQAALNLRPLPLGELLDRAFTLYFRNIVAFSALLAVVLIPSIITSYFQTRDILSFYFYLFQHQLSQPNATPDLTKLSSFAPSDSLAVVQMALAFVVIPLSYAAVVVGVSRAYVGLPVRFADCYRKALHRWLAILILIVLWFFLAFILVLGLIVGIAVFAAALAAIGRLIASPVFGVAIAIIIIALVFAAFIISIMLYLTSAISLVSVVLEKTDPIHALSSAFSRVFGGGQFWRAFVLSLALTLIYFGALAVLGGGGTVLGFIFKAPALYVIAVGMMQLFFVPFAVVAAAVYYYDIRIRREGYDLQMLVEQIEQSQPPAVASA
jgi:hypothetical protein